jgi:hypothetical protein
MLAYLAKRSAGGPTMEAGRYQVPYGRQGRLGVKRSNARETGSRGQQRSWFRVSTAAMNSVFLDLRYDSNLIKLI